MMRTWGSFVLMQSRRLLSWQALLVGSLLLITGCSGSNGQAGNEAAGQVRRPVHIHRLDR
ncbi:MAG: hypothetical protein Ct9H300mP15_20490 [Gemmatimonadota bacterium]|nr:MAG: hypothetical protein Ct9H300mP15_20490 [Gemmatimonadota bacterium]